MKPKPYVKQFKNGILINPITKENPYLHNIDLKNTIGKIFRIWRTVRNKFFTGKSIVKI